MEEKLKPALKKQKEDSKKSMPAKPVKVGNKAELSSYFVLIDWIFQTYKTQRKFSGFFKLKCLLSTSKWKINVDSGKLLVGKYLSQEILPILAS